MKLTTCTNNEMVIEARNEADYEKAYQVAVTICKEADAVISAVDEDTHTICIGTDWSNFQAAELRESYRSAKAAL